MILGKALGGANGTAFTNVNRCAWRVPGYSWGELPQLQKTTTLKTRFVLPCCTEGSPHGQSLPIPTYCFQRNSCLLVTVALLHNTQVSVIVLRLTFIYFCVCVCACEYSCLAVLVTDSTVAKEHRDHDNSVIIVCFLLFQKQ